MPNLNNIWQRFLQALALVLGLAVGVAATVFGYSNTGPVSVGFSIWHVNSVPLWSVALVPLGILLVLGTLYHWWSGLHHFTQHMHHRRRVRELEAEVASLKAHLDQVLEMPDHGATPKPAPAPAVVDEAEPVEPEPPEAEVAESNGSDKKASPVAVAAANGEDSSAAETTEAANSKA